MMIAAGAVVIEFALSLVSSVYGTPSRSIIGPASSLDTSSSGTSALAQLLGERQHAVRQLNVPVRSASLPVPGTLFVLDPQARLIRELPAIDRYLRAGGSVVLAGRPAVGTLEVLLGRGPMPLWQAATPGASRAGAPLPQDYAARTVISNTGGSWRTTTTGVAGRKAGHLRILVGGTRGALALIADVGRGRLVLLASSSPLENGLLARGDDAAFALDLAGPAGTPVSFDEYDHLRTSSGSGIAGLPGHWQAGLLLALVAVLVWILSAARRFGPPARANRDLIPPRIAHVDAMAALLASGSSARVVAGSAPLRKAAREQLCQMLRAPLEATDGELLTRAATTSLPSELVKSIVAEPRSEQDLLALGRAYATLTQRGRWS